MASTQAGAVQCLRGVIDAAQVGAWRRQAEAGLRKQALDALRGPGADRAMAWPNGVRLAHLPALFDEVCHLVHGHPALRKPLLARLGPRAVLLADHCWIRHQRAPAARVAGQAPHGWHQDGALCFDFNAAVPPYPPDALLPMAILWLPLVACGEDAPALGWFEPAPDRLLAPAALSEAAIRPHLAALGLTGAQRHAVLAPGDLLLFGGGLVHHTHATPAMHKDRSSLELRWLPADGVPARLARGRTLVVELGD